MSVSRITSAVRNASAGNAPSYLVTADSCMPHIQSISVVQRVPFLVENLRRYGLAYNLSLFLAAPELWQGFCAEEWQTLFAALAPRPSVQQWDLSELMSRGEYSDICFLIRWLSIDALRLVVQSQDLTVDEKKKTAVYVVKCSSLILQDDAPLPVTTKCERALHKARDSLVSADARLHPTFTDGRSLVEHAHGLFMGLG